ncbi:MAG: glutaminyl-tRNA synthase (glutamine-hydrolyzing) subunit B [Candidatus Nealsonbacteria bacterium RIFOXYD1_FULL_39_11]|nr:MAG: glutaminyl-tRNA synthase (glutamine-hydrolyzing) subunit B [Candidatus Nealsonbacteria bacterium RIFOXYD1_FULL_39_11]
MYKPTIGLEIHAELNTKSKMFCSCKNDPLEKRPNFNICPVCTAQPGTLPVVYKEAVRKVIKTGLALGSKIAKESKFDRKNYFYPDLPKGYQISQYDMPFCEGGFLEIEGKKVRIKRIHLEEDTGRLIHKDGESLVDLNRAGVPLMEMVTEPDIYSGSQARQFAQELQLILRYLGVSNADMEKGQMRVEVNISLSKTKKLGTKVEIKNLNSFRVVEKAVDYEIERQTEILEEGGKIVQETRGWHDKKQKTLSQREKEEAHDYRYLPEPDLPTFHIEKSFVDEIKREISELPSEKRERFRKEYGLENIEMFVSDKDLGCYFEQVMSELKEWVKTIEQKRKIAEEDLLKLTKLAYNYITTDLQGLLAGRSAKEIKVTPENFGEFIALIYGGKISSKTAKQVLAEMMAKGKDPSHIIEEGGLGQIEGEGEIESIVKEVIGKNKKAVEDYKGGKEESLQFLLGQVMAATKGRAKPDIARDTLKKLLK